MIDREQDKGAKAPAEGLFALRFVLCVCVCVCVCVLCVCCARVRKQGGVPMFICSKGPGRPPRASFPCGSCFVFILYIYTYIHTCMHTYICMYIYVCMYVYICIIYKDIYICIYIYVYMHASIYMHMHSYTRAHAHTHPDAQGWGGAWRAVNFVAREN